MSKLIQSEKVPQNIIDSFRDFGTATISSALREVSGIRRAFMLGPVTFTPGKKTVGIATTLQFLPKREDIEPSQLEEDVESKSALWSAVVESGDGSVLVVVARGNLETGCLGDMLMTSLYVKGVQGLVVDGCVRDTPHAKDIGLPLFLKGATPHNASHYDLYPWDYNIPIGCGGILVIPGDIIVGDDDGVVVIPPKVAEEVLIYCEEREGKEDFGRIKLSETGDVSKYYPMNEEALKEYEVWKSQRK